MIIKHHSLSDNLQKKIYPFYIVTGNDHYLLNDAATIIKQAIRKQYECDEQIISLEAIADWEQLQHIAMSFNLFSDYMLLDARLDKKTIETSAKKIVLDYLANINSRSFIILRAPNLTNKQLQFIASNEQIMVVQAYPLSLIALQRWVETQLKANHRPYESHIPALICQSTQGNMLACAQVIEKLMLVSEHNQLLTTNVVAEQLSDQCHYQLYELAQACLNAQKDQAIHLLRQARDNKTEPTLLLWLISQEIRLLIQLSFLRNQAISLTTACHQLKIWPQRAQLYETALKRLTITQLYSLLTLAQQLDERIKTSQTISIWHGLEQLAMGFATA